MPQALSLSFDRTRQAIREVPFLIPVLGHRYLPASPCAAGYPVFSAYGTDIIYYGMDLPSYFAAEFRAPNSLAVPDNPKEIALWWLLTGLNDERLPE